MSGPSGYELREMAYEMLATAPTPAQLDEDEDGLLAEAWSETIALWASTADDKLDAYRALREAALARAADFKAEAKVWSAAQKAQESLAKRMDGLAFDLLKAKRELTGESVYVTRLGSKVRIGTSQAVVVLDEAEIPAEYWIDQEPKLDKAGLAKILKASTVPGAKLETREGMRWR